VTQEIVFERKSASANHATKYPTMVVVTTTTTTPTVMMMTN
jgi:hypothetical protein